MSLKTFFDFRKHDNKIDIPDSTTIVKISVKLVLVVNTD